MELLGFGRLTWVYGDPHNVNHPAGDPAAAHEQRPLTHMTFEDHLTRAFETLTERQRNAQGLLTTMHKLWGSWTVGAAPGQIQFNSVVERDAYRQASAPLQKATEQIEAAMRAWVDWQAAQKKKN